MMPPLNGLILAGGKSTRMGYDKGLLNWQGKPHRYFLADLLTDLCEKVFISCNSTQIADISPDYKGLEDQFLDLGPFGGLLSAFNQYPAHAWLIIACDLPLLDKESITNLISARDSSKFATTYINSDDQLPEPLLTIWEPKAYPAMQQSYQSGNSSLRYLLKNNEIKLSAAVKPDLLLNVNTTEEAKQCSRRF
jgi:molybdopterin-guanine dinucleotide biosynthesis protein A